MSLVLKPLDGPLPKPTKADRIKVKKPKKKAKTYSALLKDADRYFSKYVRLRDSEYKEIDDILGWWGECITCPSVLLVAHDEHEKPKWTRNADNGHFVSRGHKIVRFNEMNCNLQCKRCNKWKGGEYTKYRFAIRDKYGVGVAEELEQLAQDNPVYRHPKAELEQIISDAKEQIEWYLKQK